MLLDDFLPVYDVSDAVATLVNADLAITWNSLIDADLMEVGRHKPLVGILGAIRILPEMLNHLVHGELPDHPPQHLRLCDLANIPLAAGGWVLLGERKHDEIAFGLLGKFWLPIIEFAAVSVDEFRDFAEPSFAKTVYSLSVRRIDDERTLLTAAMRTATTDKHARRWFRRYWTLGVGSGAHVLVNGLLEVTRGIAEKRAAHTEMTGQ